MASTNPPQEPTPSDSLSRDSVYLELIRVLKATQDQVLVTRAEARDANIRADMAHVRAEMAIAALRDLSQSLNAATGSPPSSASPSPTAVVPYIPPPAGP